jgi:hypothetical protein
MAVEQISFSNVHTEAGTGMKVTDAKDIDFRDVVIRAMSGPPLQVTGSERVNAAGALFAPESSTWTNATLSNGWRKKARIATGSGRGAGYWR